MRLYVIIKDKENPLKLLEKCKVHETNIIESRVEICSTNVTQWQVQMRCIQSEYEDLMLYHKMIDKMM